MSLLSRVRRRAEIKPPRILIYGVHGIGKTTWASTAPSPLFLCCEDGLGIIDAPSVDLTKSSFGDVMDVIAALYTDEHEYKSVIIDSMDWLEPKIWAHVCAANGWKSLEDPGYGKGYIAALDVWRQLFDGLNALRDERGMAIIMIAHNQIKNHTPPDLEPYDRYEIKLHKGASALVQEHADCVFFANFKATVVKTDTGFNKQVSRGVGRGQRVIYTEERPAFTAKNRFNLPNSMDMNDGFGGLIDAIMGKIQPEPIDP